MVTHTVAIAGASGQECRTLTDATVEVGRNTVREKGRASYAALTVRVPDNATDFVLPFDRVAIDTDGAARFAGHVAEVDLIHERMPDGTVRAHQRIAAVGALASWGGTTVGEPTWPQETVAERAQRIADLIGEPIVVQGGADQTVAADDVDSRTAYSLIEELVDATGGWVFDHAGTVYLQAMTARKVVVGAVAWDDEPVGAAWDDLGPDITWQSEDANPYRPIDLDGCYVRFAPAWMATHEIANAVAVTYNQGDDSTVVVEDADSIARYGRREIKLDSLFVDQADALEMANLVLGRNKLPLLGFTDVTVDLQRLPAALRADLLGAMPGTRITINGLPLPAPQSAFNGVLEGWTDRLYEGGHEMTMHISDVRHSLAVPVWDALEPTWLWDDEPAGESWESEFV